jgi:hypothetical protein
MRAISIGGIIDPGPGATLLYGRYLPCAVNQTIFKFSENAPSTGAVVSWPTSTHAVLKR